MLGSLVIQSVGTPDTLPIFKNYETGSHTPGRNNGVWFYENSEDAQEVYLPQRDKEVTILCNTPFEWAHVLRTWEAQNLKMTQADKLGVLVGSIKRQGEGLAAMNTKGQHGSWSLLNFGDTPFYVTGVKSRRSVQVVWSDTDIVPKLRSMYPEAYTFYRFPNLVSHAFLNTQAICSKWWRWSNSKSTDILKLFNALEVNLIRVY